MSRNTKNVNVKKPYCKVCHDAGKPESDYTSHWVKDFTGNTICPTLLNTECRYCYKLGHTAKFCDVLAKNKKNQERAERRQSGSLRGRNALGSYRDQPNPSVVQKKASEGKNLFAALCDDVDSEEEEVSNAIGEYPSLCQQVKKVDSVVKSDWAAIAAKPKADPEERKPVVIQNSGLLALSNKPIQQAVEAKVEQPKPAQIKKCWADWSDSEDEDDDVGAPHQEVCVDAW